MRYLSVCSGIEAATVAWHPLGWEPVGFSEIDVFCRTLLKHYYPAVPLHGDFTAIKGDEHGAIDVLVGGTPCQDFSVAGLRAGIAGDRGNLTLQFLHLVARTHPKWIVWENVPGVLSVDGGRAFGAFLGGLAELGYGFAYRVLDAQYFGLAQRRARVFVVGHLDYRCAAAVLFEQESLSGHPPPCRQARQDIAAPLGGCTQSGGYRTTDLDHGAFIPEVMAHGQANAETAIDQCPTLTQIHEAPVVAFGGNNTSGPLDVSTSVHAHGGPHGRLDFESETFVTHSLRADGFDASEDGTGRGTPLIVFDTTQLTHPENRSNPQPGDPCHPLAAEGHPPTIAFNVKDHGADATEDLSPTLRGGNFDKSWANGGVMPAVAFADLADPVAANQARTYTREGTHNFRLSNVAHTTAAVRRLTPTECERLQGFPDSYTLIPWRGKLAPDGPRYKALGNSFAVPVVRWIGERIALVEKMRGGK